VQGIREIFIDEIYRLPDGARPTSLVDLGANIGLATIWLCRAYEIQQVCVVEPLAGNVAILRTNLRANHVDARVVSAAVGLTDGSARFSLDAKSNMGRLGEEGSQVTIISVDRLLGEMDFETSLLKMDIEGAEGDLVLARTPVWLDRFDIVATELHPEYVDVAAIVQAFASRGFDYFAPIEFTQGTRRWKRERVFAKSVLHLTR
jgi:FkbM family methyltransferase